MFAGHALQDPRQFASSDPTSDPGRSLGHPDEKQGLDDDDWAQEAAAAVTARKEAEDEANTTLKQLYVGNLDRRVSDVLLFRIFSLWGQVELCKVIKERGTDLSLGYGFVGYYDHEDAQKALAASAGCTIYDRELRVRWAHSESARKHGSSAGTKHTLFVGDLGVGVTDLMLTEAFSKFGECIEARVVRNPDSGKSRGYGFVSYLHQSQAERALRTMHGSWLGSRNIRVNWSSQDSHSSSSSASSSSSSSSLSPPPPSTGSQSSAASAASIPPNEQENTTVYIGNLGHGVDDRMIQALFQPFGTITEVRHQPGNSFGFVVFTDTQSAATAIATLGGRRINDRTLRCSWGKEASKSDGQRTGGDHLRGPPVARSYDRYPRFPPQQPATHPQPAYPMVHASRYGHIAGSQQHYQQPRFPGPKRSMTSPPSEQQQRY